MARKVIADRRLDFHALGINEYAVGSPGLARAIVQGPEHRLRDTGDIGHNAIEGTGLIQGIAWHLSWCDLLCDDIITGSPIKTVSLLGAIDAFDPRPRRIRAQINDRDECLAKQSDLFH